MKKIGMREQILQRISCPSCRWEQLIFSFEEEQKETFLCSNCDFKWQEKTVNKISKKTQNKPKQILTILILFLTLSCHFVTPDNCEKLCVHKGVKVFSNICIGLIYNGCICKSTYIETENKGYNIKIEELKRN